MMNQSVSYGPNRLTMVVTSTATGRGRTLYEVAPGHYFTRRPK